jgi:hypothetical protein
VNVAKPQRMKENSLRPVWAEDAWLQKYAGNTLEKDAGNTTDEPKPTVEPSAPSDATVTVIEQPEEKKPNPQVCKHHVKKLFPDL